MAASLFFADSRRRSRMSSGVQSVGAMVADCSSIAHRDGRRLRVASQHASHLANPRSVKNNFGPWSSTASFVTADAARPCSSYQKICPASTTRLWSTLAAGQPETNSMPSNHEAVCLDAPGEAPDC